jgi:hypothetical protein
LIISWKSVNKQKNFDGWIEINEEWKKVKMDMKFSFDDYYNNTVIVPIIMIVIVIIAMVSTLFVLLSRKYSSRQKKINIIGFIFFSLIFLLYSISSLKYGYRMIGEKEEDFQTIDGEITSIEDVFMSPKYMLERKYVYAKIISINDKQYYIMDIGDFLIGDDVQIKCLSNSSFVLEIVYFES